MENGSSKKREVGEESDLLIVGGEDHKTGEDIDYEDRFNNLIAWTKERFPTQDIQYHWSGQVMEPKGSLAFIGPFSSSSVTLEKFDQHL